MCTDSYHLTNRRHSCRMEWSGSQDRLYPPAAETDFKLLYCYVTHVDQIL